jgi:hypothetical protein
MEKSTNDTLNIDAYIYQAQPSYSASMAVQKKKDRNRKIMRIILLIVVALQIISIAWMELSIHL